MPRPTQRYRQHRPAEYSAVGGFIDRYGWRAYALPVLLLLTVVALFRAGGGHNRAEAAGPRGAAPTASNPPGPAQVSATATATSTAAATGRSSAPVTTSRAPRRPGSAQVHTITLAADPGRHSATAPARARTPVSKPSTSSAASTPCRSNTSARKVVVSIAAQHAWMCARSAVAYSSKVTTGRSQDGHATPTGTFRVQGNVKGTTLTGADYAVHVDYWIQFNGDIGFHDASWQTIAFGSAAYKSGGSLGCVHMPLPTVAWLHKWVQVGRTVVVVTKA
jgi:lipoprotein-anchoring transpeptidase ErfK/SrfK